jgi:hypothetical protein
MLYKYLIIPLFFFTSCNTDLKKESVDDLQTFKEHIAQNTTLDTTNIGIYTYPTVNKNAKIYINDILVFNGIVNCDSLPGCILCSMKKEKDSSLIKIICQNNIDTIFKINNNRINKIIIDFNTNLNDNKFRIFSNENKSAWEFEY